MKKIDYFLIKNQYHQDLVNRGKNCLVYDYHNYIVKLSEINIWFDNYGNYVKPRNYVKYEKKKKKKKKLCIIC
tara:strand:- start:1313 stop:1531 length:219 start_codon:yes stop_codon:yes gene_type:complete